MVNSIIFWQNTIFVTKIDQSLIDVAESSFSESYKNKLQKESLHYTNSLSARYIISKYLLEKNGNRNEIPIWIYSVSKWKNLEKKIFFSYSFTHSILWYIYIAWIVASSKVGIDAEFIKERNISLFQKYRVSNRESFYKLRTAKEAIVKYNNLSANELENIDIGKYDFMTKKLLIDNQEMIISIMI